MSLHDKLMNLPHGATGELYAERAEFLAYKTGHRDARHAAAELAVGQDAVVEKLAEVLGMASIALDDWLNIHAPEFCDEQRVAEAQERINAVGTLAYIADMQALIRFTMAAARGER